MAHHSMTIGTFAKTCGVPAPTVRYYEEIGLVPKAQRNAANQRRYTSDDLAGLTLIRRCRDYGFSIEQTRELLALSNETTHTCTRAKTLTTVLVAKLDHKMLEPA